MTTDAETRETTLLPAYRAARIACCTARSLAMKADRGELRYYLRPGFKCRFYEPQQIEALRPRLVTKRPRR